MTIKHQTSANLEEKEKKGSLQIRKEHLKYKMCFLRTTFTK
jgi:hypothetical protein